MPGMMLICLPLHSSTMLLERSMTQQTAVNEEEEEEEEEEEHEMFSNAEAGVLSDEARLKDHANAVLQLSGPSPALP